MINRVVYDNVAFLDAINRGSTIGVVLHKETIGTNGKANGKECKANSKE